jgi:hypothetical protein
VKIRVSAKATDPAKAEALIGPVEEEIRARLGEVVFGADEETVESIVVAGLARRGWRLGTIEEATLGQVAARIAVAGPDVFAGSTIVGPALDRPPDADVLLTVGPIGPDLDPGPRTTRRVEMRVTTPEAATSRAFDFGGDDERVRSFATVAGLHLIRIALAER